MRSDEAAAVSVLEPGLDRVLSQSLLLEDCAVGDEKVSDEILDGGFWTVKRAADFLAISRSQVYEMMATGLLRSSKFGRSRRIPAHEVLRYARECMEKTA